MKLNTYQKTAIITVFATIFLIFVGGLVRVSGSGLGCPDWPRCFGSWIPPLSVADLPARFDPSQFNIFKTWTEYINRLVGIVIGILITATGILSLRYRKTKPPVFYNSVAAFILVLIQGWLGGEVVESGLKEWLVTVHMLLAMAIMTILLYAAFKATEERWTLQLEKGKTRRWMYGIALTLFAFTIIQMILGTQVRTTIDDLMQTMPGLSRDLWISHVGSIVEIHRSFSWTIFLSGAGLLYFAFRKTKSSLLQYMTLGVMTTIVIQILLGVGLYYMGMPPVLQVLHLVGVAIIICLEFLTILILRLPVNQPSSG
ncbi:MAG TPA: COX15/CtaA family protein [Balneolaceae bacterium]|nr:COX15/CtaA family protein [Balneolaceae bacterium]